MRDLIRWLAAWEEGARFATSRLSQWETNLPDAYYDQPPGSDEITLDGWRSGWTAGVNAPFEAF